MPRIVYKSRKFGADRLEVIRRANAILEEYAEQGFDLTLRQLYYQFVSRGLIPNNDREYNKLGSTINDARLAGRVDWDHIVDRTRFLREISSWDSPEKIVEGAAKGYRRDLWESQPARVEVWIEKDALIGVIEGVCDRLRVPHISCRGYTSQSEMWSASQRFFEYAAGDSKQRVVVLHLGDHDPSGIDMSRDIEDRIFTFMASDLYRSRAIKGMSGPSSDILVEEVVAWTKEHFELQRLALNWEQVQQYEPPPNPAKLTDSRSRGYVEEFGHESWELDALEPSVIAELIEDAVFAIRDEDAWVAAAAEEKEERATLAVASRRWAEVAEFLTDEEG